MANGEDGTVYTSGYAYIYTGNADNQYYSVYLGSGFAYAGANEEGAYFFAYFAYDAQNNEAGLFFTAPGLPAEYYTQIAAIENLRTQLAGAAEFVEGQYPALNDENAYDEVNDSINDLADDLATAAVNFYEEGAEFEGVSEEAINAVAQAIEGYRKAVVEKADAIVALVEADNAKIDALRGKLAEVEKTEANAEAYEAVEEQIDNLKLACQTAMNKAYQETGEYTSPVTEEAVKAIEDAIEAIPTEPEATLLYTEEGEINTVDFYDDETFAPAANANVQVYDSYIIIEAWGGVEGYDLKVAYDENQTVTSLTSIVNGEEGETVTSSYYTVYTGQEGDNSYFRFYVGSSYTFVQSDEQTRSGYFYAYGFTPAGEWTSYYLTWPVMPEGLRAEYETLDDLYNELDEVVDMVDNEYPAFLPELDANTVTEALDNLEQELDAAYDEYLATREYTPVVTEEKAQEIRDLIDSHRQAVLDAVKTQRDSYELDLRRIASLRDELAAVPATTALIEGTRAEQIAEIASRLDTMEQACDDAWETCIEETAVYDSPLSDDELNEVQRDIDALTTPTGIEGIAADRDAKVYTLQGVQVSAENLPAGMYIINGKKVIVRK